MRAAGWMVFLAMIASAVPAGASGAGASGEDPPPRDPAVLVRELRAASGGDTRVTFEPGVSVVRFVGGSPGRPLAPPAGDPSVTARTFVDHFGPAFGVSSPTAELREDRQSAGAVGVAVRFRQQLMGVPVLAGELAVQIGADGSVVSATGETSAATGVATDSAVSAIQAAATALGATAKWEGIPPESLTTSVPEAWIYDPTLIGAPDPGAARLVWKIDVTDELGAVDRVVLVDANTGGVALSYDDRHDARQRQVCTNSNARGVPQTCSTPARVEGQGPYGGPGAADVNDAYDLSGVVYDYYSVLLGRDSVDGNGLTLKSTVLYCPPASQGDCPYANAFWNGAQMVYGDGYAGADDVVGHELTHGVTQYTSQLLYYSESGAINESISDVMGELIDLDSTVSGADPPADRWQVGEQLPGGAVRNMSNPPQFGDPDRMTSPLYRGDPGDAYGVHANSGVNNKAATLIADGGSFNGQTITGIGTAGTAKVYYQAETTLLGPGSDYRDLYDILPQACAALIGSSTPVITEDDCQQVSKAVVATEMNLAPTIPGARLTAPVCDAGAAVVGNAFGDDMEANSGNFTSAAVPAAAAWSYFAGSSQSGNRSLYGPDLAQAADASAITRSIVVPADGATYLRFEHSFSLEAAPPHYYDGGVVEYRVGAGDWQDAGVLPGTVNGYNATLESAFGNPLSGRAAFSANSPGYQQTRIDLTPLGGATINVRFRVGSDSDVAEVGWFVDDVSIYTCTSVPAAPTAVSAAAGEASATVSWAPPSNNGASPITGYVITPYVGATPQPATVVGPSPTTATIPDLGNGTTYTFTVRARNALGDGPPSTPPSNTVTPSSVFVIQQAGSASLPAVRLG